MELNEKILKFADEHDLYILGQNGRDRITCRDKTITHYTIAAEPGIASGEIKPNCTYEQFIETVAIKAIDEAQRLWFINNDIEEENDELYEELEFIKAETGF